MASSVIHHIGRDSTGLLWFSGRGGISRYDGFEFTPYRIAEELPSPLVHNFFQSRDGVMWISVDGSFYRAKPEVVAESKPLTETLPSGERRLNAEKVLDSNIAAIFEDSQGRLWVGTNKVYLVEDRDQPKVRLSDAGFAPSEDKDFPADIRVMDETQDGSIWFGYTTGLGRLLPNGRWVYYEIPSLARNEITISIRHDSVGRVWFTHTTGVFVFKPETVEELESLPEQRFFRHPINEAELGAAGNIELPNTPGQFLRLKFEGEGSSKSGTDQLANPAAEDFFIDADDTVWLPTMESIFRINDGSYRRLKDTSRQIGTAKKVAKDLAGNIWIGTFAGAFRFSPNGVISYDQVSGLRDPIIHAVRQSGSGPIVFHGTWFVSKLVNGVIETKQIDMPSGARFSWTSYPIFQDSIGGIWALTTSGLYKAPHGISGKPELVNDPVFGKPDLAFYRAFTDGKGNSWFSVRGTGNERGLFKHDPRTNKWENLAATDGFPKLWAAAAMAETRDGAIWFGMYQSSSLFRLFDGKFTEVKLGGDRAAQSVFGLAVDSKGRLWVGSSGAGVMRIEDPTADTPEIRRFTEADGLTSNNVRSFTIAPDGSIYAGTISGVSRIDLETDAISSITVGDGLAADFVYDSFADKDGVVWIGTTNGLSRYEPTTRGSSDPPKVLISDLTIAGTHYSVSQFGQADVGAIEVPADQNDIRVNFFGVSAARRLNYRYRLEGSTAAEWSAPTEQRSLNLANLSPGNYRLLVNAVADDGTVSTEPASVSFKINPPFWQRWWFVALLMLLAGGAVFALDRYRVAKTRQIESALALSRESESRFRTLADTASDAIITIDENSQIVFVNGAIEKVFGYTPDELIGQHMPMLMPERMRGGHHAGLARYISTGNRNINWSGVALPGLHKDGYEIPLEVSFGEFEREGKRFFTGIARDVSERHRAERALQEAREERFRELQRVRTRIASDLHDDIGSSLTQIAVLSEVARGQAVHPDGQSQNTPLDRIKTVSKELVAVMSDIVWAINPQKDYLHDLILRMRRFGSDLFTSRGISFELIAPNIDDNLQLGANIRREAFAIFKEAANNSAKYSDCKNVRAEFKIENEWLILKFEDDGNGFDTEKVLSDDFRPEMGGNGIVSMQKRAAELGGKCEFKSRPGEGTTVLLKIPLRQQPETNGHNNPPS